ncbi:ribonuclease HII [Candidatus Pacearchaeota archaeon]|nr:ribonuclease HII [Candidatus Pacearchaeota archaeon]
MLKIGVDDAGRGPVIGPMILAGVLIDDSFENELRKNGVKDSKQLSQKRREHLEGLIKEKAESFDVEIISPAEIDKKTEMNLLNELEAEACARIINKLNKTSKKIKVIVDCPSVSIVKWKDSLKMKIDNLSNLEISCEHKADINHIVVSAASVLAKCVREKEMDKLREKYGSSIGSGYPADPLTKKFLEKNAKAFSDDGIFRKSWATWKDNQKKAEQKRLI